MKSKGSNAERELVATFHNHGWSAVRVAGSGRSNFPCTDVLASNGSKVLAVECKSTKHPHQYFEQEQIDQLLQFCSTFGAEPMIAVKFSNQWDFFKLEELEKTRSGKLVINKNKISRPARQLSEFF